MKQTHYLTATVQEGNRLEISLPDLPIGQSVEIILIIPENDRAIVKPVERHVFMRLPMEERQRILAEQAKTMVENYKKNTEWQEWVNFDLEEIDDCKSQTR